VGSFDYPQNVTSVGASDNFEWIFAGSEDGTVRLHDRRVSGGEILYKGDCEINAVIASKSEQELIIGDQNGGLIIYDLKQRATRIIEVVHPILRF